MLALMSIYVSLNSIRPKYQRGRDCCHLFKVGKHMYRSFMTKVKELCEGDTTKDFCYQVEAFVFKSVELSATPSL